MCFVCVCVCVRVRVHVRVCVGGMILTKEQIIIISHW